MAPMVPTPETDMDVVQGNLTDIRDNGFEGKSNWMHFSHEAADYVSRHLVHIVLIFVVYPAVAAVLGVISYWLARTRSSEEIAFFVVDLSISLFFFLVGYKVHPWLIAHLSDEKS